MSKHQKLQDALYTITGELTGRKYVVYVEPYHKKPFPHKKVPFTMYAVLPGVPQDDALHQRDTQSTHPDEWTIREVHVNSVHAGHEELKAAVQRRDAALFVEQEMVIWND